MLSVEQIEQNWNKLIKFIEDGFEGERRENLLKLYNEHADRIATTPASSKVYFHSCFLGGYVHHVLNVLRIAPKVSALWESIGGEKSYTDEELFFVALNHDLGKIGDLENENYLPTTEDWKIKRGMKFEINPNIYHMAIEDRSLFLLQHYGVKMSPKEFVAIKIHDGLYEDGNKTYFMQWGVTKELDRFVYVIHFADMLASKQEYEEWARSAEGKQFLQGESKLKPKTKKGRRSLDKAFHGDTLKNSDIKIEKFEDLFGKVFEDNK